MQRTLINSIPSLKVNLGQTILSIDISWLIVLPLSAWGIATLYLPDFGNALNPGTTWLVTVIILLLATFS
jgi:hypothetical protein